MNTTLTIIREQKPLSMAQPVILEYWMLKSRYVPVIFKAFREFLRKNHGHKHNVPRIALRVQGLGDGVYYGLYLDVAGMTGQEQRDAAHFLEGLAYGVADGYLCAASVTMKNLIRKLDRVKTIRELNRWSSELRASELLNHDEMIILPPWMHKRYGYSSLTPWTVPISAKAVVLQGRKLVTMLRSGEIIEWDGKRWKALQALPM